jgi:hypothetical protein
MTPDEFRLMALAFEDVSESAHMDHPDFRVNGRIFATLGPADDDWGMVRLTLEQQKALVELDPTAFTPFPGAWGRNGCTKILLRVARKKMVRDALKLAYEDAISKKASRKKGKGR